MRIKQVENILPSGLGKFKTRSRVVEVPDGDLPEGATLTDEAVRDWAVDENKENA